MSAAAGSQSADDIAATRTRLLADWLPQLLAQNRHLKDLVTELSEKNEDLVRENEELSR